MVYITYIINTNVVINDSRVKDTLLSNIVARNTPSKTGYYIGILREIFSANGDDRSVVSKQNLKKWHYLTSTKINYQKATKNT